MKVSALLFVISVLAVGCTAVAPKPTDTLLEDADAKLIAKDYRGALAFYGKFVTTTPGHPQAARARATQGALSRITSLETELASAQRSVELARREGAERQSETERLKSEVTKLRADLERLRNIDLQPVRPDKKK